MRLDRYLQQEFPHWSRAQCQRLIGARHVRVNQRVVWLASWEVQAADIVTVDRDQIPHPEPAAWHERWVLEQRDDVVVLDKPSGLRSEPRSTSDTDNLLTLARTRFGADLALAHRLDRDTSGIVVLTRSGANRRTLDTAFKSHSLVKTYVAVVAADAPIVDVGDIVSRLGPHPEHRDQRMVVLTGGESAHTHFEVITRNRVGVLVRLLPSTGRTHQLRVHLASVGAPILGDRWYGDQSTAPRLLLHAHRLLVPLLGLDVESRMPDEFSDPGLS